MGCCTSSCGAVLLCQGEVQHAQRTWQIKAASAAASDPTRLPPPSAPCPHCAAVFPTQAAWPPTPCTMASPARLLYMAPQKASQLPCALPPLPLPQDVCGHVGQWADHPVRHRARSVQVWALGSGLEVWWGGPAYSSATDALWQIIELSCAALRAIRCSHSFLSTAGCRRRALWVLCLSEQKEPSPFILG